MRRFGKGRISVKKMYDTEKRKEEWELSSLYIAMVAAITTYFSVLLNLFDLIIPNETDTKIIGVFFSFIAIWLLFNTKKQYKKLDKINKKTRFEDILQTVSIAGIVAFILDNSLITPFKNCIKGEDLFWTCLILVLMLLLPFLCAFVIVRQKD